MPVTRGIYTITNALRACVYVGQSIEIENRLREHRRLLNLGTHRNAKLQSDWISDGAEAFVFALEEEVPNEPWELYYAERRVIDRVAEDSQIYNQRHR